MNEDDKVNEILAIEIIDSSLIKSDESLPYHIEVDPYTSQEVSYPSSYFL